MLKEKKCLVCALRTDSVCTVTLKKIISLHDVCKKFEAVGVDSVLWNSVSVLPVAKSYSKRAHVRRVYRLPGCIDRSFS